MEAVDIACPHCGSTLKVSRDHLGRKGRCKFCSEVFVISLRDDRPKDPSGICEDTIMDWLAETAPAGQAKASVATQPAAGQQKTSAATAVRPMPGAVKTAAAARPAGAKHYPVRLGHVDDMGAFFLFEPQLLYHGGFRACMPRRCILCGSAKHLKVHLVMWMGKLQGRKDAPTQAQAQAQYVVELDKIGGKSGLELLSSLPRLDCFPEPYCLPLPYYVCHSCSSVGALVTDVRVVPGTSREECELGFSSLPMAEEFAQNVSGAGSDALKQIREYRKLNPGHTWRLLPLAVRNRINQWYTEQQGEQFLAYIPDADFSKAEAGLAGVVLTDRRVVFRKMLKQLDMPRSKDISFHYRPDGDNVQVELASPDGKVAKFRALPACAEQLRDLLTRPSY